MPRLFLTQITIQNLPVELICMILGNLEMHDLLTCTWVTKHLRKVVKESSRLQYTIELAKHRMVSLLPASASPSFATRLKLLRDRERAWKYMDWKKRHTLRLPPTGSVYEFVGGLYGNGREDDSRATASISFLELPSSDAMFFGDPHRELEMWTHAMGDVTIIDFTMDPSQDLLVLVALAPPDSKCVYELHLRSIKTNRPHPKAPVSILPCLSQPTVPPQPSEIVAAVRVQVSGDLVALLIKEGIDNTGAHLEIWNWERGSQYSSAMNRSSGIDDFTFLTRDSFLLVRPIGRFEVYTFIEPINRHTAPVLRATYMFPPLAEGYMYWYISMSSNPAPGYIPRSPTDINREDAVPGSCRQIYYPRPDERIHACCLYIFNPVVEDNPVVHSFVFFLNLKTLLNPPAEWLAKCQPPQTVKFATRRQPVAHTAHPEPDPYSSDSSSSSTTLTSVDVPIHEANPAPMAGSSSHLHPTTNGASHTPLYPPFPTFESHISNSTSQLPANDRPAPRLPAPPASPIIPASTSSNRRSNPTRSPIASLSPNVYIPWEVWGSQSTRWFEECLSTDWQHAVYGLRTVESVNLRTRADGGLFVSPPWNAFPPFPPLPLPGVNGLLNALAPQGTATATTINPTQNGLQPPQVQAQAPPNGNQAGNEEEEEEDPPSQRRFLRIRDFNPYSFVTDPGADETMFPECNGSDVIGKANGNWIQQTDGSLCRQGGDGKDKGKGKARARARWRIPQLVTAPSTTPAKGVFKHDIVSSLPYMEVISEGTFEVTDVMMDDCRLLLLKRGKAGKLKRVEVLMM